MIVFNRSVAFLVLSVLTSAVFGHPGHDAAIEATERTAALTRMGRRSLAHCAEQLKNRGIEQRSIARRQAHVEKLRKNRSIQKRDFETVLNTSHHSTENYDASTPASVLFAGNNSCILTPETTEGPYYVSGELIRQNVVEDEPGVPLTFEVQVIDINTCEPLSDVLLESWQCNSTGVYGGIPGGNGNGQTDPSNINNTALRGIQPTGEEGVLFFDTVFPGHYTGRTAHIHVLAHHNATVLPNNTVKGGTISHVGQLFFDQDLITAVEATSPYNTNTQPLTTNAQDWIMKEESANVDPVLHYVLLGDTIQEGLFGWISFGLDSKINKTVSPAANWGENGGTLNPGGGAGPPGPPPSGFPTGFPPGFPPGFPTAIPTPTGT